MPTAKRPSKTAITKRQQRAKDLAKRYQKEAAILKRKGILSNKVDARKNISRATRTKINKFRDVLEGRAIAVPAPRDVRSKYSEAGVLPTIGRFVLAPKEYENQRARLKRGMVVMVRPLKNGQEEYVILPFKATDLPDLARRLKTDPTLDGLKEADEFFSFRLYGHNAGISFPDALEMGEYLEHYIARLGGNVNVVKHITFQRWKPSANYDDEYLRNEHSGKEPKVPYNSNVDATGRSRRVYGTYERNRDLARATRKAKARASETPEARQLRLNKQKRRQAIYRQRMFEEG